jgi:hypothetical protein
MLRLLGVLAVLGTIPLTWLVILALAERDYVAGALLTFALATVAHLGVELLALSREPSEET